MSSSEKECKDLEEHSQHFTPLEFGPFIVEVFLQTQPGSSLGAGGNWSNCPAFPLNLDCTAPFMPQANTLILFQMYQHWIKVQSRHFQSHLTLPHRCQILLIPPASLPVLPLITAFLEKLITKPSHSNLGCLQHCVSQAQQLLKTVVCSMCRIITPVVALWQ